MTPSKCNLVSDANYTILNTYEHYIPLVMSPLWYIVQVCHSVTVSLFVDVEVQPAVFSVLTTEGDGGSDFEEVETCLELASGNLQRNVTVNVKTMTSPTATGEYTCREVG